MKTLSPILFLAVICALPTGLQAMFAPPPDFVIVTTDTPNSFLRKDNQRGVVEVRQTDDFTLTWEAKIDDYNALFSTVLLSRDGKKLIHIFGNHQVSGLDDICVAIYTAESKQTEYAASEALEDLPAPSGLITGASPRYQWRKLQPVNNLPQFVMIPLANGKTARFYLDKHEVAVQ